MGRFSSALTSLYGRDSDAWDAKAPAVEAIGLTPLVPATPVSTEAESDNVATEEETAKESAKEELVAVAAEVAETPEPIAEEPESESGSSEDQSDEVINFPLPEMFQPNPKGMYELRTQLGIVTKEDVQQDITGGESQFDVSSDSVVDGELDESDAVLDLVQQVLGIAPEVRVDGDDGTTGQLESIEDELINDQIDAAADAIQDTDCLLYTSPSPRDLSTSRMPSSA